MISIHMYSDDIHFVFEDRIRELRGHVDRLEDIFRNMIEEGDPDNGDENDASDCITDIRNVLCEFMSILE